MAHLKTKEDEIKMLKKRNFVFQNLSTSQNALDRYYQKAFYLETPVHSQNQQYLTKLK